MHSQSSTSRPGRPLLRSSAALGLLLGACSGEPGAPFRHVVLISLDTTRADHLDPYGATRPTTPRIAALAEAGVVFEDVLSPAPTTLAAHTSIMTGTYPQTHGVARNGFYVNRGNVMLAELLSDKGFHTAGFLGSWALSSDFEFDQGFDLLDEGFDVRAMEIRDAGHDQSQRAADRVTDAVLAHVDRLESRDRERLFLFAHYFDAHQPYEPPAPFVEQFCNPGELRKAGHDHVPHAVAGHANAVLGRPVSVSDLINNGLVRRLVEEADGEPIGGDRQLANLYAGEVAYVDQQLARLFSGLEERGILQEALVVLTGDHGETFWEHGDVWNHGLWVYQTTVQVPLILRFPDGRGAGTRVAAPVSTVDLLPTLCDLLDLPLPPAVEGFSLLPAIDGRPFERGPIFSQATQPLSPAIEKARGGAWHNRFKPRAVRHGKWKYVQAPYLAHGARREGSFEGKRGLEQLFDLEADPGEQHNLLALNGADGGILGAGGSGGAGADAGAQVAPGGSGAGASDAGASSATGGLEPEVEAAYRKLSAALDAWIASARPLSSSFNRDQNDEVIKRLRELGYVGDDED